VACDYVKNGHYPKLLKLSMIKCEFSNIACETGGQLKPPDVIRCRLGGSYIKVIEGNGGTENPDTAKATGAITNAEKLIGPAA
jgi:hypothetical protein